MPNTSNPSDRDAQADREAHALDSLADHAAKTREAITPPPSTPEPLTQDEFARQHSAGALKNQDAPGPKTLPGPAEARDAVPAGTLSDNIARIERELSELKSQHSALNRQEYPKVLYHRDHGRKDDPVAPVTVANKEQEDDARGLGWTYANPGEALKAANGDRGETPNATQHTREDENARQDLPAQMAVDQDARTGKPPVDLVVDSDAPDPGASHEAGEGPEPSRSARAVTRDVKKAASKDVESGSKKKGGGR
jgi:hypothetical protein